MSGPGRLLTKIPAREWRGLVPKWQGGRLNFALVCDRCGETDHWSAAQMIGPQTAIPKIIQLGWDVNGKLTCPICVSMKNRSKPTIMEQPEVNKQAIQTVPTLKAVPSPLNDEQKRKNKRIVIAALEDYFDDTISAYRGDKSDKAVASELDLSEAFVAAVREEMFGPIKPPSEVQVIMAELTSMHRNLDVLQKRFDDLVIKNGWRA